MKSLVQRIKEEVALGYGFMTDSLLPDYTRRQVARALQALIASGLVFAVSLGKEARYFPSRESANDWLAAQLGARMKEEQADAASDERAPWPDDTPAHYPTNADGTPAYRFTVCPTDNTGLGQTNTFSDRY
jgi:hypothetical protein